MDASKKPKQHKVQLYLFYKNTKSVSRSNKTPFILQKTQWMPAKNPNNIKFSFICFTKIQKVYHAAIKPLSFCRKPKGYQQNSNNIKFSFICFTKIQKNVSRSNI